MDDYEPPPPGLSRKLRAGAGMFWSRPAARAMAAVVDEFRPDIVHLHNIYHQLSPSILAPIEQRGIPMVMTLHDFKLICPTYRLHDGRESCEACLGGGFQNAVLRRCKSGSIMSSAVLAAETAVHRRFGAYDAIDRLVCPSEFLRNKLIEAGFESGRLQHIPNFTSTPLLNGPRPGGTAVLSLGRLSQEKGIDTLIRACALEPARPLRIAGDGRLAEPLRQLATETRTGHDRIPRSARACRGARPRSTSLVGRLPGPRLREHAAGDRRGARPQGPGDRDRHRGEPGGGGRQRRRTHRAPDDPVALRRAIDQFDDRSFAADFGADRALSGSPNSIRPRSI